MANTTNLNLEKPAGTDKALVSVINSNSDKIDAFAGTTNQAITNVNNNLSKSVSQINASPQSGESLFQLNGLKFYRARSSYDNGWVLELRGTDAADKDVRIGFDKTGGVYCYYDNTLQWNIRP